MEYQSGCLTFQPFFLAFISTIPFPSENQPTSQPVSLSVLKVGNILCFNTDDSYTYLVTLCQAFCKVLSVSQQLQTRCPWFECGSWFDPNSICPQCLEENVIIWRKNLKFLILIFFFFKELEHLTVKQQQPHLASFIFFNRLLLPFFFFLQICDVSYFTPSSEVL